MMGISEGAYGTESLTPFWADRFAGGCAMAGGAGGGERFYNLRNTAFRNDTDEGDTIFDRIDLFPLLLDAVRLHAVERGTETRSLDPRSHAARRR